MDPKTVLKKLSGEFIFDYQFTQGSNQFNGKVHSNNHLVFNQQVLMSFFTGINTHHDSKTWAARAIMTFDEKEQRFKRVWIDSHKKGAQSLYFGQLDNQTLVFSPAKKQGVEQPKTKIIIDFSDMQQIKLIHTRITESGQSESITAQF